MQNSSTGYSTEGICRLPTRPNHASTFALPRELRGGKLSETWHATESRPVFLCIRHGQMCPSLAIVKHSFVCLLGEARFSCSVCCFFGLRASTHSQPSQFAYLVPSEGNSEESTGAPTGDINC